ncbi:MAG: prephenate dehydratase domain-containing protein [Rectinema sp.]
MTLEDLRTDIDKIDGRILSLLGERMEKAVLTRKLKKDTLDSGRETAVLDKVSRASRGILEAGFSSDLYRSIMAESKRLQEKGLRTMGFQGEHGAYGEAAASAWAPDAAMIPCREFSDVFDAVEEGLHDLGIVPVENTLGGLVGPVNTILLHTGLRIVGAVDMPISHCLLCLPGADHRELRSVWSHSQALAQCKQFLARNRLEPVSEYDTAGAAKRLAAERPKGVAAIASRLAAEIYGLEIIKEDIQDASVNRTRFFILARRDESGDGEKCSAVFTAGDKAGALFRVLEVFADASINLTRIESVPDRPGEYAIFIDFEGSEKDPEVSAAITRAASLSEGFRILGCYREKRL